MAKARLFLQPKMASEVKQLKLDESFYIGAGGIYHFAPDNFAADPKEILHVFRHVAETGCELDIRMVDLIRNRLRTLGKRGNAGSRAQ